MNIQLPTEAYQFIEGMVAMCRQQLRAEIQQGIAELDTGMGIEGLQVFDELRLRAVRLKQQEA